MADILPAVEAPSFPLRLPLAFCFRSDAVAWQLVCFSEVLPRAFLTPHFINVPIELLTGMLGASPRLVVVVPLSDMMKLDPLGAKAKIRLMPRWKSLALQYIRTGSHPKFILNVEHMHTLPGGALMMSTRALSNSQVITLLINVTRYFRLTMEVDTDPTPPAPSPPPHPRSEFPRG